MKKRIFVLLVMVLVCSMLFANGEKEEGSKVYELKLGHCGAPTHHYQTILTEFVEDVKEKTNGGLIISVFPSDQLGNQMESTQGVMIGTQDMVLNSDMVLSNWIPEFGILNLPYLFKDNAHMREVLDGPIGDEFSALVVPQGAINLAFFDNGFRDITNSKKPINTPEDLEGMKIRVPEGSIYLQTFKALGALPTVISFGELYSALQLKTVDGQENPPAHVITQKFYEVQKYIAKTNHIHSCSPLLINKKKFDALPEEYQQILVSSAKEYAVKHTALIEDLEAEQWKEIEANGMEITSPDPAPFAAKMTEVYAKAKEQFGAKLIDEILATK